MTTTAPPRWYPAQRHVPCSLCQTPAQMFEPNTGWVAHDKHMCNTRTGHQMSHYRFRDTLPELLGGPR